MRNLNNNKIEIKENNVEYMSNILNSMLDAGEFENFNDIELKTYIREYSEAFLFDDVNNEEISPMDYLAYYAEDINNIYINIKLYK